MTILSVIKLSLNKLLSSRACVCFVRFCEHKKQENYNSNKKKINSLPFVHLKIFTQKQPTFCLLLHQIIYYDGIEVGTRRADFIVENKITVEIKALINLEPVHLAQAKNYVVAYDFPIGLLINFGATSLQFNKVYNPKYNKNV